MTRFQIFKWEVLAIASLCSVAGFAAGGDGQSFHGPITAGMSIPASQERMYTKGEVLEALKKCQLDLARTVVQQAFKESSFVFPEPYQGSDSWDDFKTTFTSFKRRIFTEIQNPVDLGSVEFVWFSQIPAKQNEWGPYALEISVWRYIKGTGSQQASWIPSDPKFEEVLVMPYFTFQLSYPDGAYDDWGNLLEGKIVLDDLTLVIPATAGPDIALYHRISKKKTDLRLNTIEYAYCLANELGLGTE